MIEISTGRCLKLWAENKILYNICMYCTLPNWLKNISLFNELCKYNYKRFILYDSLKQNIKATIIKIAFIQWKKP